jgi:MOSC domain-containing protein YiiM
VQKVIEVQLADGAFAENILTEGIRLHTLAIGTRLKIGKTLGVISQIGKECHNGCAIRELAGDCVMPREGVFIRVLKGGKVKTGDEISLI